ncbi:RING finger domain-containing protein [Paracoccidioides lutzii Pb01]|uniref:RING finger domain-containing protein n=1 Tax=Paracoccidioides lutzii (strain ATCC MYA-826 / Pb01) TaxID=502779 RepID=C1GNH5_PARBA|nr:RING finger domain-containing protein [Paracoccidioides lutzii Pb01]EEH35747.1 RING finger domain-containing protein [Paracoccidioides lutzii Pb01]
MSLPSGPKAEPQWQSPENTFSRTAESGTEPASGLTSSSRRKSSVPETPQSQNWVGEAPSPSPSASSSRHYPPRTCRICLETVFPTFEPVSENLPDFLQAAPRVTYESADPELGRLIRPCKCKGSSRYVHEGCLNMWRHADPAYSDRNYWQCPTCGFQYRLERMRWGRWITSTPTQLVLTVAILLLAMFVLGFVADPIIKFYIDPFDTIFSRFYDSDEGDNIFYPEEVEDVRETWTEHFFKGLASLGVLSFVKVLFALSPWQWWNLRNSGLVGGARRPAATGRDRAASVSWIVLLIGVITFLWGVYKGVRTWSRKVLEKAGDRVLDVPLENDDEPTATAHTPPQELLTSKKED